MVTSCSVRCWKRSEVYKIGMKGKVPFVPASHSQPSLWISDTYLITTVRAKSATRSRTIMACHQKFENPDHLPVTNQAIGEPESTKEKILETGASMVQSFDPPKRLCAHL